MKERAVADLLRPISQGVPKAGRRVVVKRGSLVPTRSLKHPFHIAALVIHDSNYPVFINSVNGTEVTNVTHWAYLEPDE